MASKSSGSVIGVLAALVIAVSIFSPSKSDTETVKNNSSEEVSVREESSELTRSISDKKDSSASKEELEGADFEPSAVEQEETTALEETNTPPLAQEETPAEPEIVSIITTASAQEQNPTDRQTPSESEPEPSPVPAPSSSSEFPKVDNPADYEATPEITFILNTHTMKFHYPACRDIAKMDVENRQDVTWTREEIISKGYSPCGHCHP